MAAYNGTPGKSFSYPDGYLAIHLSSGGYGLLQNGTYASLCSEDEQF